MSVAKILTPIAVFWQPLVDRGPPIVSRNRLAHIPAEEAGVFFNLEATAAFRQQVNRGLLKVVKRMQSDEQAQRQLQQTECNHGRCTESGGIPRIALDHDDNVRELQSIICDDYDFGPIPPFFAVHAFRIAPTRIVGQACVCADYQQKPRSVSGICRSRSILPDVLL